jgi:outer membrane protein assembly factor BamB
MGAGFSSLAVVDGRIFTLGDRDGSQFLLAFSADGGAPLWKARVGPVWSDEYGGPRGTPTVAAGHVFALGTEGDLVAVEAATGKEVWRRSLPADFGGKVMSMWKWAESPLVDGDRVIVTPGAKDAGLVALDRTTGKEIWRSALPELGSAGKDGAAYSSVVISNATGVKQYVQLLGRGLVGVRASDGKFLWGYNRVANQVANIATPIVRANWAFASTGYQTGSALVEVSKAEDASVRAREIYFLEPKTFQNHHGGMVLVGNHVYSGNGHNKGFPICIEFATGKVAWGGDIRNAGTGSAAVAYADGHLYFRYQNGVVMLIQATPEGYREKGSFTIPGVERPSWSHPVILDGRLYLREQDTLYVYDVKKTARV